MPKLIQHPDCSKCRYLDTEEGYEAFLCYEDEHERRWSHYSSEHRLRIHLVKVGADTRYSLALDGARRRAREGTPYRVKDKDRVETEKRTKAFRVALRKAGPVIGWESLTARVGHWREKRKCQS